MALNGFDIAVATVVVLIGLKGFFNGAVKELSGLIGLVLGLWGALRFADRVGDWIGTHILPLDSPSALHFLGFLSTVSLVWLLFVFLGALLARHVTSDLLQKIDPLLGFLFASLKIFLLVAVFVHFLSSIEFVQKNTRKYISTSRLYPLLIATGHTLFPQKTREVGNVLAGSHRSPGQEENETHRIQKAD